MGVTQLEGVFIKPCRVADWVGHGWSDLVCMHTCVLTVWPHSQPHSLRRVSTTPPPTLRAPGRVATKSPESSGHTWYQLQFPEEASLLPPSTKHTTDQTSDLKIEQWVRLGFGAVTFGWYTFLLKCILTVFLWSCSHYSFCSIFVSRLVL